MDLAGAKFPSADSLSDLGTDLQKAYALYCYQFKDIDHNILPFEDYCYRYAKIKINYDGADHLFSGVAGEQGADTTLSQVRFVCSLAHGVVVESEFKAFIFHTVPTVIQGFAKDIRVIY